MPLKKKTKVKKKVTKKVTKKTKNKKKVVGKVVKEKSKELIIKTKPQWVKNSLATKSKYQDKYSKSIKNNDEFWRKEGKRITSLIFLYGFIQVILFPSFFQNSSLFLIDCEYLS